MRRLLWAILFFAGACTDGNASFSVRESVEQVFVTHAPPGAELAVVDGNGQTVATATADSLGSIVFRHIAPGAGYTVRTTTGATLERSRHFTVMSVESSQPPQRFYDHQTLAPGFNYIVTRDGTKLSAYVTLPGPLDMGPYPTVVDYSGYEPSKPGAPIDGGKYSYLCDSLPVVCDAPNDPSATIAAFFGYATVSVNVRGTGCSGGAYDFFETLQLLDGYDVIETVAAQKWVAHGKVGMVGLSYPGITQLFVASTRPPHLAAITPLSVIGSANSTMLPGGILNDGFATDWITNVLDGAKPYGQGWEQGMVDAGDTQCAENQLLHGQYIDNVAQAKQTMFYDPAVHDKYNPATFVNQIDVPVFLAGAWQDEQTGPYFFTLLDKFTSSPSTRFSVYNGVHPDGFQPKVLAEWEAFLDIYVAERVPVISDLVKDLLPIIEQQAFKAPLPVAETAFSSYGSVDDARAAWEAQPHLRALFESGAGDAKIVGAPVPTFELSFPSWPPPGQTPTRWYFQPDGTLAATPPTDPDASSAFMMDPAAGTRGNLKPGGDVWDLLPAYDWEPPGTGKGVAFESAPLPSDLVMMGNGSVDLWLKSTANDADLEVNLVEVRPDGQEMYVQSGWLRASYRKPGPSATELWPAQTFEQQDWAPLVPGEWTQVRVGFAGFQHVFRAGSKIRIFVNTPGGSRAAWRFALKSFDQPPTHTIGHDATHPSSVVLPVLAGVSAPSPLPACPSLRGQPCRAYAPLQNRPGH